jgi:hypothetical protein
MASVIIAMLATPMSRHRERLSKKPLVNSMFDIRRKRLWECDLKAARRIAGLNDFADGQVVAKVRITDRSQPATSTPKPLAVCEN